MEILFIINNILTPIFLLWILADWRFRRHVPGTVKYHQWKSIWQWTRPVLVPSVSCSLVVDYLTADWFGLSLGLLIIILGSILYSQGYFDDDDNPWTKLGRKVKQRLTFKNPVIQGT